VPFEVFQTEQAERDIEDIYQYIAEQSGIARADRVLADLEKAYGALAQFPERGNLPKELRALGIEQFREIHHKPYRVIYRIVDRTVVVHCVIDGRRDMQSLLQRQLVR